PGGKSLVMAGMLGAKYTSHLSKLFLVVRRDLEALLSDCPCFERAWAARTGQGPAVTRAMPRAFDRNSSLEVIKAFADRIFRLLFGSLYSAEILKSRYYLLSH